MFLYATSSILGYEHFRGPGSGSSTKPFAVKDESARIWLYQQACDRAILKPNCILISTAEGKDCHMDTMDPWIKSLGPNLCFPITVWICTNTWHTRPRCVLHCSFLLDVWPSASHYIEQHLEKEQNIRIVHGSCIKEFIL